MDDLEGILETIVQDVDNVLEGVTWLIDSITGQLTSEQLGLVPSILEALSSLLQLVDKDVTGILGGVSTSNAKALGPHCQDITIKVKQLATPVCSFASEKCKAAPTSSRLFLPMLATCCKAFSGLCRAC